MIQLEKINKFFGDLQALQDIDLHIASATIHGIVGENGAGKSTLMKILTGFLSKSSGTIKIAGEPQRFATPAEASDLGIGMLYQEPLDFPQLPVLENFMAGNRDHNPSAQRKSLAALCDHFNFQLDPEELVERLTVGERQQLELLRLIRNDVRILILDEPTTGISERQQQQLFDALRRLRDEGRAILLVSHKLEEIEQLCDNVTVLRSGRVVTNQSQPFDRTMLLHHMFESQPITTRSNETEEFGETILTFENVTGYGGRSGLQETTLCIRESEVVGLAGVDGSGQSLFLRIAAGLTEVSHGNVFRFGESFKKKQRLSKIDPRITFLPADRLGEGLFANLSIREHHILASAKDVLLYAASGRRLATEAIERFTIHGTPDTRAEDLSGGNQQRLLLSLIPQSVQLLLVENPTRGLDVRSANWTWQHLQRQRNKTSTIIFASPDLDEIMTQATRVLVFFDGRIVMDCPTRSTTRDEVTRAITGATVH